MARLLGCSVADVEADRLAAVRRCAEEYQSVVVLKGQRTLTTAPGMPVYVNTSGNPGMATGGSGDVLAGITAAWLAQGMQPLQAAAFAVYLHGLAGDLAAAEKTQYAMTALDIVHYLPAAYQQLLANKFAKTAEK
jgi:NAD(P)H-hydrate epimerase